MTNYYNSLQDGRDTVCKNMKFGSTGTSPTNVKKTSRGWLASMVLIMALFIGQFANAQLFTIGAGANAGTTGSNAGPIYRSSATSGFDFSVQTYLYTAAELAAAGVVAGDQISSVAWNKSNAFGTNAANTTSIWKVYMKNSSTTPSTTWGAVPITTAVTGATLVYNNTAQVIPTTAGYVTLTFATPFTYTGGSLEISSDWDCSLYTPAAGPTTGGFAWRSDALTNSCFGNSNSVAVTANMALQTIRPQIQMNKIAGSACTGIPDPGNTLSSAAAVCSGVNFTLSLENLTSGGGVTYVWESADDMGFTSGVTTLPSTFNSQTTSQTADKYYRCSVTCDGNTTVSNPVQVTMNDFLNCYCSTGLTTSGGVSDTVVDMTIGSFTSGLVGGAAPWYTAVANTPIDLLSPSSQVMTITMGTDGNQHSAVWIDLDHSGTFDASENLALSTASAGANAVVTYTIVVPPGALPGLTRMRVRGAADGAYTAAGACTGQAWGETEDYLVNIIADVVVPPDCATALVPADAAIDVVRNPTLSWTAGPGFSTSYDVYFGDTYPGVLVNNQTGLTYTPAAPLMENTLYYWQVIAKNDSGEATGCLIQSFTTGTGFNYCSTGLSSFASTADIIANVTVGAYVSGSVGTNLLPMYTAVGNTPIALNAPSTQPISITVGSDSTQHSAVWIDFNQDGTFDASENVALSTVAAAGNAVVNYNLSIPATALPGVTMMRVRAASDSSAPYTAAGACALTSFGETEDYLVDISLLAPCAGAPDAAVAVSSAASVCTGVPFTLSVTGETAGLGITYQWESATDMAFTAGVTALGTSLTQAIASQSSATYYRMSTTCATGPDTTNSNVVFVDQNAALACYCTPVTAFGCGDNDIIAQVVLNTLNNNSGTGCPSDPVPGNQGSGNNGPGYSDYTTDPLLTTTLQAGSTYSCTVTAGQWGEWYGAWIDYNDDGVFDNATERIGYTTAVVAGSGTAGVLGSSASFPITLACNPPLGVHRLRVRAMFGLSAATVATTMTPCGANSYGEVEDYLITISAPDPCPTPSALAITPLSITTTGATATWVLGCAETEWDALVQLATDPAPTAGSTPSNPGLTATTTAFSGLIAGTNYVYYVRAVCDAGAGLTSSWAGPFAFTTLALAPGCTVLTYPADAATGIPVGTIPFTWSAPAVDATHGAAASYDLYYGVTTPGVADLFVANYLTTNANITLTGFNATFYIRLVPKNSGGDAVGPCTVTSFTTEADPFTPYCSNITYTSNVEPITSVNFAGINNTSSNALGGSSIENFISVTGNVSAGASYTMTVKGNTDGAFTSAVSVFVDWNQDGDFDDAGESYDGGSLFDTDGLDAVSAVSTILVPSTATAGTTRLRIKKLFAGPAAGVPCTGGGFGQTEDYSLSVVQLTSQLNPYSCGSSLAQIYSNITAIARPGVDGYRFKVTDMSDNSVQILDKSTPSFNLTQLPTYAFAREYSVEVMLSVGGTFLGYYGPACSVYSPGYTISPDPIGPAAVVASQRNTTLPTIYSAIFSNGIAGVSNYHFEVTNMITNLVQTIDSDYRAHFRLTNLPFFTYATPYSIRVAVKTASSAYGPFGTAYVVNSPAIPMITECGSNVSAGGTIHLGPALSSVTNYEFSVNDGTTTQVINSNVPFFSTNHITGYDVATTYTITVRVTSSGLFSPSGLPCIINPVAAGRLTGTSSEFSATAYPNPFATNFKLDVSTSSSEVINVVVYDMVGKMLSNQEVNASDINTLEIGNNYSAGMYNVIVSQGNNVKSIRMVKN